MGTLYIAMKMIVMEKDRTWMAPLNGSSPVFAVGANGELKAEKSVSNILEVGNAVAAMVAQKTVTIRRYSDLYSLDIYQAFENNKQTVCILEFSEADRVPLETAVWPGIPIESFVLGIFSPKIKLFEHHAPSKGANTEKIKLEFDNHNTRLTYGMTIEQMRWQTHGSY